MLILIRQIRVKDGIAIEQSDSEFSSSRLSIGSGSHCDIQLAGQNIPADYATLSADGQRLRLSMNKSAGGSRSPAADYWLNSGDIIDLGQHKLLRLPAPPGFDAAVEIRIDDTARAPTAQRFASNIQLKLPATRRHSYLLLALVFVTLLLLPLLGYLFPGVQQQLNATKLPSDAFWNSGPLADAHHLPGLVDNCQACHRAPFKQVDNDSCIACHQATPGHGSGPHPRLEDAQQCTACHKEHNEPATLIVTDNQLCVDCHRQAVTRPAAAHPELSPPTVAVATAFEALHHPVFKAALLKHDGQTWQVRRQTLDNAHTQESSNLNFSHQMHLGGDKVQLVEEATGRKRDMQCADCHQLNNDGEHFAALTMESACEGCHSLSFDDSSPARRLPHGNTEQLLTFLEEYYLSEAVRIESMEKGELRRRVPKFKLKERCDGLSTLECGQKLAAQDVDLLFSKAGCVTCHQVNRAEEHWRVEPVRLVSDWFTAARFDHRPHLIPRAPGTSQGAESANCGSCHAASDSKEASDVLMPTLDSCLACHQESADRVPLQCVDCHRFHRPGLTPMGHPLPGSGL